ncbi:MAG: hypothetical protein AAF570_14085, partial [Bacteroidota bacterium]
AKVKEIIVHKKHTQRLGLAFILIFGTIILIGNAGLLVYRAINNTSGPFNANPNGSGEAWAFLAAFGRSYGSLFTLSGILIYAIGRKKFNLVRHFNVFSKSGKK